MDASSGDRSSPRSRQPQLQGPRPPRLAVSKDSHKVRKPPIAPQRHPPPAAQQQQQQYQHHHQQQQRQPVIIYDASPKVIHTKPGDFMALVQRLTGPGSTSQVQFDAVAAAAGPSAAAASSSQSQSQPEAMAMEFEPREFLLSPTAALSPAARLAAIETSVRPLPPHHHHHAPPNYYGSNDADFDFDFLLPPLPGASGSGSADVADSSLAAASVFAPPASGAGRPGILSPAALPPAASTGLFSPTPFDPNCLSWLSELSPFLPSAGTRAAAAGLFDHQAPAAAFAPSPRSSSSLLLSTPTLPSPATFSVLEFFSSSNFPDL